MNFSCGKKASVEIRTDLVTQVMRPAASRGRGVCQPPLQWSGGCQTSLETRTVDGWTLALAELNEN